MKQTRMIVLGALAVLTLGGCAAAGSGAAWLSALVAGVALLLAGCPSPPATRNPPSKQATVVVEPTTVAVEPVVVEPAVLVKPVVEFAFPAPVASPAGPPAALSPTHVGPGIIFVPAEELEVEAPPVRVLHSRIGPVWTDDQIRRERVRVIKPLVQE